MDLGNIWSNYNSNKGVNSKKIISQTNKVISRQNKTSNINSNTNTNVFHNIFTSKTGINKAHIAINSNEKIISGFSKFKKNYKDSKAYWGTPTWYLFHSIAAKINPSFHKQDPRVIWNFIKKTCAVLPCPYCRYHAINYVNKISIHEVNTKEKLINVLFVFHNSVNQRNNENIFQEKNLKKYNNANIDEIFKLFKQRFFKSYYNTREFQDWSKTKFKNDLINFINETKDHYN
jgi:hypothetical protein